MNISSAYLLVFHGSRERQYRSTISELGSLLTQQLCWNLTFLEDSRSRSQRATASKSLSKLPLVDVAALEFADVELWEKIVSFAHTAIAQKYSRLVIVPIFLSAGVHVRGDIPHEIALAKQKLPDSITIESLDFIGNASFTALIGQKFAKLATEDRVLLAHGSRLPQGNDRSEQLAQKVNARIAYWAIQPDLTSIVESLARQNQSSIAIVPYFLFSGKITEAIASLVARLQVRFPKNQLHLARPLGATTELAQVIATHITMSNY